VYALLIKVCSKSFTGLVLGKRLVVMLEDALSEVQLGAGSNEYYDEFEEKKEYQNYFCVSKQDLMDIVPLEEEVLVSIEFF
jgi:hypothetical protein